MIKFYKNYNDYANQHWISRQKASRDIQSWKIKIVEIPKWAKFFEIDFNT